MQDITDVSILLDKLKTYDDLYHNGMDTDISDSEYDSLKEYVRNLDPTNKYFTRIGSDVRGGKIALPYVMGSLDQIYENEFDSWLTTNALMQSSFDISDKLDGTSVMIVIENNVLQIAYSRGDGTNGADITRHVKHLSGIPSKITYSGKLVIRGEAIMTEQAFEKYSKQYKNSRNLVAGCMNRKETDINILHDINFIAYKIVDSDNGIHNNSFAECMNYLKNLGFNVVEYVTLTNLTESTLKTHLKTRVLSSPYKLDGVVVYSNDIKLSESADTLNPRNTIKYKILDTNSIVNASVKNVHWEISKSGFLKPRVEIMPVELGGVTITYATGFNAKYINDNGIGIGAIIQLTRSGDVIPYILKTLVPVSPLLPDPSLQWYWNDTNVEACVSQNHSEVLFKCGLDFFETLNVDLLKESSFRKIFNYLNPVDYDELIFNTCSMEESEFVKLLGINGSKVFNSLSTKLKNLKFETFLGAVKYMGVGFGVRKAKMLLNDTYDETNIWHISESDIVKIDGFDTKTASTTIAGLQNTKRLFTMLMDGDLISIVKMVKNEDVQFLSGVNVVFTGFRDYTLENLITNFGGKVSGSVSLKTNYVLTNDLNAKSTKIEKAQELNIPIMLKDAFITKYNLG